MSLQHRRIKKQPRDNRFSINLTNDETSLLTAASNLSGIEISVLIRQMAMKQAIHTLVDDSDDDFNLYKILSEGAKNSFLGAEAMLKHEIALTEQELKILQEVQQQLGLSSIEETIEFLARERIQEKMLDLAGEEIKRKRHL